MRSAFSARTGFIEMQIPRRPDKRRRDSLGMTIGSVVVTWGRGRSGIKTRCGGRSVGVDVSDDGASGDIGPLAVLGDAGEDAHGAKDGAGGDGRSVDVFHDALGDSAKVATAASEEARGGGVAIDRRGRRQRVNAAKERFRAPSDEVLLDELAIRVIANGAFASVAGEVWV